MAQVIIALLLTLVPVGMALLLLRHLGRHGVQLPRRRWVFVLLAGALIGAVCAWVERAFFALSGLSLVVSGGGSHTALLAMFLFAAPLEEGAKAAGIWPLYVRHKIGNRYEGVLLGVLVAAGFAAAEAISATFYEQMGMVTLVRYTLASVAHLFAAGLWGYLLGRARGRWFFLAWLIALLVRALHDHIIFGRGAGMLALAVPMDIAMLGLGLGAIRDIESTRKSGSALSIAQPPPLKVLRRALRRTEQPLMLRWIVVGAFVTGGAILVCLAGGVFIGHQLGVDFSLADEANARSNGPLILLAVSVMAAFPIAGYLVARASAATSVLEPALGASLTIGIAVAGLIAAAPVAVLFALATTPIAFLLVCAGAWVGLAR